MERINKRLSTGSVLSRKRTLIGVGIIALVVLFLIFRPKSNPASNNNAGAQSATSNSNVRASQGIGKEYEFPLKDSKGIEVSKFKYTIDKAEISDTLRSKDGNVNSGTGKTFLVLTLKITNSYEKTVQINTKDYLRLSMDGRDELFAPDLHNDPVEVQAISTKTVKVAFLVLKSSKDFILQVGEIKSEKEKIPLSINAN